MRSVYGFFTGLREFSALVNHECRFADFINGERRKEYGKDDFIRRCFAGNLARLLHVGESLPHGNAGLRLLVFIQEVTDCDPDYFRR